MLAILSLLLPVLGPILNRAIPDPAQAAQAQADLTKALLDNQGALNAAMAEVMQADAKSEGVLTRNARPATVLWGLVMVTWLAVVAPMLGVQKEAVAALQGVPAELWNLITVGIGAYMLGKTVESGVKALARR